MNGVGGLTPANGRVEIYGTEVSRLAAHRRHRHRLGRAFQAATLFPDLTVRETVQVALERRLPTRFWPAALALPPGVRRERRQVRAADDLIGFFGLGDYADKFVAELSTGTRRIVELACLVAGGSRLLCLDEPTAGVAQREAEALVPLLVEVIRTQLAERDAQFDAQAAVGRPMETFFSSSTQTAATCGCCRSTSPRPLATIPTWPLGSKRSSRLVTPGSSTPCAASTPPK